MDSFLNTPFIDMNNQYTKLLFIIEIGTLTRVLLTAYHYVTLVT